MESPPGPALHVILAFICVLIATCLARSTGTVKQRGSLDRIPFSRLVGVILTAQVTVKSQTSKHSTHHKIPRRQVVEKADTYVIPHLLLLSLSFLAFGTLLNLSASPW